ncbi:calcium and integrin-binding protein 1-like [Ciona intestinalis]|uniref:Calcium and integrin-binding protein 1-like n=1 Tax=Ciona intestinalis TaxID=7719 RepID=H2XXW6_CIOIN|nr:calcium and integrin-binding protein 1-like [Ciona intestinalis]|eukprot:XP_002128104.1 calcium and integrin-binding protein 1-like [Ciona intestinalis]
MGSANSHFTKDELQEYSELTFFTKQEVLHVFEKFVELDQDNVNNDKLCRVSMEKVCQMPELKVNPFNDRICRIFSTSQNFDGSLSFEDFLDMMSVFSDQAPKGLKVEYAFKVYDFNEDDLLDAEDIEMVVSRLTGYAGSLKDDEMQQLLKNIMQEADLDNDDQLSYAEFEHVISKSPDFLNSFRIRL